MINRFPSGDIALKIAAAVGLGMLVGLEREWANKDIGVRTFSLAAMLGMLGGLISLEFALGTLLAGLVLVIFVNFRSLKSDGSLEITTSAALLVTVTLGVLVGQGHLFTPVSSAIVIHTRSVRTAGNEQLQLGSPVSLRHVLSFGAIFC